MSVVADVEAIQHLDFDELSLKLVEATTVDQFGSSEPTQAELKSLGRAMFTQFVSKIRPTLCGKDGLAAKVAYAKETEIIAAVVDLVAVHCSGMPVAVLAAMVLKYGFNEICKDG
jgi:hypothetical protein